MRHDTPTAPRTDRVAVVVNTASRSGARALALVTSELRRAADEVVGPPGARWDGAAGRPGVGDGRRAGPAGRGRWRRHHRLRGRPRRRTPAPPSACFPSAPPTTSPGPSRSRPQLTAAVDTLLTGKVVDVDLGRVDGRAYLNVASLGLSVAVTHRLTPGLKRRLGRFAYPAATLAAYRGHRPFARPARARGRHRPRARRTCMQVAIGNGRHYGGGLTVAPNASIDDHLLDVYAVGQGRLRDHVSIARLLADRPPRRARPGAPPHGAPADARHRRAARDQPRRRGRRHHAGDVRGRPQRPPRRRTRPQPSRWDGRTLGSPHGHPDHALHGVLVPAIADVSSSPWRTGSGRRSRSDPHAALRRSSCPW